MECNAREGAVLCANGKSVRKREMGGETENRLKGCLYARFQFFHAGGFAPIAFYGRANVVIMYYVARMVCTWCACGVHVVCTWCAYGVHVVCMWCACGVHVVCTWCACGVHVVCMWCACGVHMVCMWCARWLSVFIWRAFLSLYVF
jgi:hypothetical protein